MHPTRAPFPWQVFLLGLLSGALYALGSTWQPPLQAQAFPLYFLWFSLLFGLYIAALRWVLRRDNSGHPLLLPVIIGWALVFRLSLLWVAPGFLSTDLYRYLWDGLVQQAGINPYHYPPEAPELAGLQDDAIFPFINRKWAITIYPPGAQLLFWLMAWSCPGNIVALKGMILLADGCALALLLLLLKELRADCARVLMYAWHPLVLTELGISAHLDGVMIPCVLLALYCSLKGRAWAAGLALGGASLLKLYPAILLPALYRRRAWQMVGAFIAATAAGYLLYFEAGGQIFGYLPQYLAPSEEYNLGARALLQHLLGRHLLGPFAHHYYLVAQGLTGLVLLVAMGYCLRQEKRDEEVIRWGARIIALYLLLVTPSVYQWYLLWLLALTTLAPTWSTPAWLYWSWSVNLDMLTPLPGLEASTYWLRFVEYGPVFLWLGGYWLWTRYRRRLEESLSYEDQPHHPGAE